MVENYHEEKLEEKKMNFLERFLHLLAIPKVDLFICIGSMERDILKELYPNAKYIVVYPFINEERYKYLLNIPIKNEFNHNILFIGNGPDYFYKGLDLLVEAFKIAKREFKDSQLFILGNWDNKIRDKFSCEGVNFVGFSDIYEYIQKTSLYVHLGRGDTFPVSNLEALLGGIPCIISEYTGTKEIIRELREDFILPLDSEKVAKKIIEYFYLPKDEKIILSSKAKELGKNFKKEIVLGDFIKKWKGLVSYEK